MSVDLRCERRLWRAFSLLGANHTKPPESSLPRSTKGCLALLFLCVVILPIPVVAIELSRDQSFSWGTVFAWSAVIAIGLVGILAMRMLGTSWWMNGAGEPVLSVSDGVLRGRLSPATKGTVAYTGWDFEVPLKDLAGVRLTPLEVLVLHLPDEVSEDLRNRPQTAGHAHHWEGTVGSPTAWPGKMLRKAGRTGRLNRLVAELDAQRSSGPAT